MAGSSGQSDIRLMFYEDCDEMLETEALSGIVRRQSKYGSTSSSHTNHFPNQKLVTHVVQPHDTLPGQCPHSFSARHHDSFALFQASLSNTLSL